MLALKIALLEMRELDLAGLGKSVVAAHSSGRGFKFRYRTAGRCVAIGLRARSGVSADLPKAFYDKILSIFQYPTVRRYKPC